MDVPRVPAGPHRRLNPLTGEWTLVSPQRVQRPWQGQVERVPAEDVPAYDPNCYLCPGNARAGGARNPDYQAIHVFTNDFAALLPEAEGNRREEIGNRDQGPDARPTPYSRARLCVSLPSAPLFQAVPVPGTCRVMCFSPRHDLSLPEMPADQIRLVIDAWAAQTAELGRSYRWVQAFENKGTIMGCSNRHPHGQIWALDALPNEPALEDRQQRAYLGEHGRPLLLDYAEREAELGERVVLSNQDWLAVVPFWAVWPYEVLLLPRRHVLRLPDLLDGERESLATALKRLLTRYDNLFEVAFPYSMGWHGAPFGPAEGEAHPGDGAHWQLHAHFYPPLLRSATVKKFMVGFEMLAEAQRDITPESAAEHLRAQPEVHYRAAAARQARQG